MELPAFFFDIDGTLLDYPHQLLEISPKTKAALDELGQSHPLFVASGRTNCFIDPAILAYPFDGFVTCNGAYGEYQKQCVYKDVISQEAISAAMALADEISAVLYLESRDVIYTYHADLWLHADFARRWDMKKDIVVSQFDPKEIETYIAMMVLEREEDVPKLARLAPYFDVTRHVHQCSFDLTLKDHNKALGILKMMEFFHSDLSMAWAFGDGNNDLEMIASAGHGIAMGNAVEALKKVAFDVTDTAVNDGIALALKKYGFIK